MGRKALNVRQKLPVKPACDRNTDQVSNNGTTENSRIQCAKGAAGGPPQLAMDSSGKPKPEMDPSSFASARIHSEEVLRALG